MMVLAQGSLKSVAGELRCKLCCDSPASNSFIEPWNDLGTTSAAELLQRISSFKMELQEEIVSMLKLF